MKLSKIAVGLSALVMLSAGAAQARGLMDFITFPHAQEAKESYRSGTINPSEALALYSSQQKQASFDGCADLFPAGRPISVASVPPEMKPMALCSDSFAVLFHRQAGHPWLWLSGLMPQRCEMQRGGPDQSVLSRSAYTQERPGGIERLSWIWIRSRAPERCRGLRKRPLDGAVFCLVEHGAAVVTK